jgi:hypothetical protein
MAMGYSRAPVVIALNPAFAPGGGEPIRKFTIAAYEPQWLDIPAALAELNELEQGWGGSPTIGGSPQGVSSTLSVEQVVDVVARHHRAHWAHSGGDCWGTPLDVSPEGCDWCEPVIFV